MTNIKLGKIQKAVMGICGYQDQMIGYELTFSCGVSFSKCFWKTTLPACENWTEKDRIEQYGEILQSLCELLRRAKVKNIDSLIGIPVEVTFEGQKMIGWRILEEVL